MSSEVDERPVRPKRRLWRWVRRFLVVLVLLLAGGVWWLNGPGLRMLAPRVAAYFAEKAGAEVAFELRGSLTGGLSFHDVAVSMPDAGLEVLTVAELAPDYEFMRLIRGEVRGVSAREIHLDLEIVPKDDEPPDEPFDFAALNETLREVRELVVDHAFDVSGLTAVIRGPEMETMELGGTSIRHAAGSGEITIEFGGLEKGGEGWVAAQRVGIEWTPERIGVDRLVYEEWLDVEGLELMHPEGGGLFAQGVVNFADAVFEMHSTPEQGTLGLRLREGALDAERMAELAGMEVPVGGRLTSFSLEVENLAPDPMAATATLGALVERVTWEDAEVDEIGLDVTLDTDEARAVARAAAGDAVVRVETVTALDRSEMALRETRGEVEIPSLAAVVDAVVGAGFWEPPEDAGAVPESVVGVDFRLVWGEEFAPASVRAEVDVAPVDGDLATSLGIAAGWTPDAPVKAKLVADGFALSAEVEIEEEEEEGDERAMTGRYDAHVYLNGFESGRIEAWLAAVAVELPGAARVDAVWNGKGALAAEGHEGELVIEEALWLQPDQPEVRAVGEVAYGWPGRVEGRDLQVERDGQRVDAAFSMADGWLEVERLRWTDADGTEMAEGRGSLPVPETPADWSAYPREDDERALDFTLRTETLTFDKLASWAPGIEVLDGRGTARLEVSFSGSFAEPALDAVLEVRDVRVEDEPAVPAADLVVNATGRDGRLAVDGKIETRDYEPAVLKASLPFAPAEWAAEPDTLMESELEAELELPRLDLRRFAAMAPDLRRIAGVVTGWARASGTLGDPVVDGRLELAGGTVGFPDEVFPDVTGITAVVEADLGRVALRSLRTTVAGGTLEADGTYQIEAGEFDVRARGNSLPLVRDEGLIVRANADLRVAGAPDGAAVSGTVSLLDSLFFRDIELLPIGTPFSVPDAAELPKIDAAPPTDAVPEALANWTLDVRLRTEEPLLIRGNLATGRILMDLRVGGRLGDPRPDGTVRLLRGRAVLPFSTLAIPEAVITFTPANGLDPSIELNGTAEPRPYTVNILAYGRLSDPQIVLTSNPPLPQHEIMTLLATGTTTRGLEDPQAASSRALQLFVEEVRRGRVPLGNQLRPLLGLLDRVDFTLAESDPYSSDTFSTATLKLHDRWYLSAGMGDEGNTRTFAIWRLRFR